MSNKRRKPGKSLPGLFIFLFMVPRDRILCASGVRMRPRFMRLRRAHKLPTRGFSDQIF